MSDDTSRKKAAVVIPARYQASRLPGKLLLNETGKYLIQHVYENASQCDRVESVYIATNSDRIAGCATSFGANVIRTGEHDSGTSRISEASRNLEEELILNIQGDEPEVGCSEIHALLNLMQSGSWSMGTLSTPITDWSTLRRPSCVKVVTDAENRALYFSRGPVPWDQDRFPKSGNLFESASNLFDELDRNSERIPWQLHLGLYGFTKEMIERWNELEPGTLEQLEELEQLRALENGIDIGVKCVEGSVSGVDTREEYEAFVRRYSS